MVCVPSTYFIGEAGVPLEVTGGHVSPDDFHKKIEEVLKVKYQKGQVFLPRIPTVDPRYLDFGYLE